VFYDEVEIPLSNVVGEIDGGWSVAMTTFGFERGPAAFGDICELEVYVEDLIAHASTGTSIGRPIDDTSLNNRLAMTRAKVQSLRALMYLMVASAEESVDLGAEGSILHLPLGETMQAAARLAMDIAGPMGVSRRDSATWVGHYLNSFCATIAGGTSEILRNVISERLLGLPR
jgi:alkylation response protein AidB-like acyl-CoA dehydrogenase